MDNKQYNLQFDKLCNTLDLGTIIGEPKAISGGLLHKMFAIQTTKQKYAVKALNPQVMLRPAAKQNILNSERIANCAAKSIPAAAAKIYHGTPLQKIDGQYYLIFDWVEGRSLQNHEIGIAHCKKIADILAELHTVDFSELGLTDICVYKAKPIDWSLYLEKGQKNNAVWINLMRDHIDRLYDLNYRLLQASKVLAENKVISHGDLDSKNVLWCNNSPVIIDWEAAGFSHPMCDLLEIARYWSENENEVDKDRFIAFISTYKKRGITLQADWDSVFDNSFFGQLNWLEYSLKRSLRMECTDEAEQQMGTEHVIGTIKAIKQYQDKIPRIRNWLNNEI